MTTPHVVEDLTITNYVDGQSVAGASERTVDVLNPSTSRKIAAFVESSAEQVDQAVKAARAAADGWSRTAPGERANALLKIADLLQERIEEFASLESADAGKPFTTALTAEVPGIVDSLRYFAGAGRSSTGPAAGEYVGGHTTMTRREPVGVVAAITPWNFPLHQAIWKIAPALVTGNTVVVKPAENTPISTVRFVELAGEVLPAGVLNVVNGRGSNVGQALVAHPGVDLVSFTGSTGAGRKIAEVAAAGPKRFIAELGGNAPVVVFDDVDLDKSISKLANGVLFNAGQECMAGSRILVSETLYDTFVERLAAELKSWKIGDCADPETRLGPLISETQLNHVRKLVENRPSSSDLVVGGDSPDGDGFFFNATLVGRLSQADELVQQEIFGPVATVQTYRDEDEALAMANDTPYGLAASVWTRDVARVLRFSRDLKFGMVWVNDNLVVGPENPIGGFAASGYGKEGGAAGLDEFTQLKQVVISNE